MISLLPPTESHRARSLRALWCAPLTVALCVGVTACQTPKKSGEAGDAEAGEAEAEAGAAADDAEAAEAGAAEAGADAGKGPKLGRFVEDGPVPWTQLLRKTPEEVEKVLGPHTDIGSGRITCVRFLPERTFFECKQEMRIYDLDGFESLYVDYEDGKAATVAVTGFEKGEQGVEPNNALQLAGLELPVAGKKREMQGDDGSATIWEWFNSLARLKVGEDQFMVRLSTVDDDWNKTKLEVIVNSPLTDDEKSRIKAAGAAPASPDAGAAVGGGGDPAHPETVLK